MPNEACETQACTKREDFAAAGNRKGRDIVRSALREASAAGLNVLRTFAHTTDDNFPFQVGLIGLLHPWPVLHHAAT